MITAANAVGGSQLIKKANGSITLLAPNGLTFYEGIPSPEAILEALEDEEAAIKQEISDWLFRVVGIADSRFHSLPINAVMTAPKKIPRGIGIGRL